MIAAVAATFFSGDWPLAAASRRMPATVWPELTKRPEFYSYGTNQERQAAFLLTSGIVLSGLNPTVFSDRPSCGPPQT